MKILIIFLFFFLLFEKTNALENTIVAKINNQIITAIDLKNEQIYLSTMNDKLKSFTKKEFYEIAKKSLITEKVKEIEVLKYYKLSDISEEYLKSIIKNIRNSKNSTDVQMFKTGQLVKNLNGQFKIEENITIEGSNKFINYLKIKKLKK